MDGQLSLDVYQTDQKIIILAPIAGIDAHDVGITLEEDVLTIRGKRHLDEEIPENGYITQECFWGDFSRSIVLPPHVNLQKIKATFKNGVLRIEIPRLAPVKTKVVKIREYDSKS